MKKSKRYFTVVISLVIISFLGISSNSTNMKNHFLNPTSIRLTANFFNKFNYLETERTDGGFYSFIDIKNNKEIDRTARRVFKGDAIILADNSRYEVVKIVGDNVYCQYRGIEKLSWNSQEVVLGNSNGKIVQNYNSLAFYSTHTDESYVPTSGTESEPGKGDILQVGKVLADNLKNQGIKTEISFNKHDPHDANAYQRSRRTAVQLLKNNPKVIIDVHRDGVPDPNFYAKKIDGKSATQVRLVVGRQNQNMEANLEFAKSIKAFYDEKKPGLIKGIFLAKGNYNQDLSPRSILIEVGTHTNSLKAANNGAIAFASLLPEFLGLKIEEDTAEKASGGVIASLFWIVLIFIIGGLGFLLISTGSIQGSVNKIKGLGKEFSSYLGNIKGKRKN